MDNTSFFIIIIISCCVTAEPAFEQSCKAELKPSELRGELGDGVRNISDATEFTDEASVVCPHLLNKERLNPDASSISKNTASLSQNLYINTFMRVKAITEAHATPGVGAGPHNRGAVK